jgi:glutaryl-CoA dehydrogenase
MNEFVLNWSKNWITNSPIADVFVIWARNSAGKIRAYLIEKDAPALKAPLIDGVSLQRASTTGMIFLEDFRIWKENEF